MALEQYNFSSDFQDMLLAAMVRYPDKFVGLQSCLSFSYFTGLNTITTAKLILDYAKKYNVFPSFTVLGQLAYDNSKKSLSEDFNHDLVQYVQMLSEMDVRDVDYLQSQVINFARERAILIEITQTAKNIQEGKDHSDLIDRFQKALTIGVDLTSLGMDAKEDADTALDMILNPKYGVPTGYDMLDTHFLKRGMGKGWLVVPLAPPKGYKTTVCLNLAMNIAGPMINEHIVYYTCEINEELALKRIYLAMTQQTEDQAMEDPTSFREKVHRELEIGMLGKFIVKFFPAKTATMSDIRAHLRALCLAKGFTPRVVVIDYAETVLPEDTKASEARQQSSIYTGARALADEFDCTVIMPDRCNRETVERAVPSMTSFQGAFEKGGIVDAAFGICATPDEYRRNIIRLFVFLYRHGPAGLHFKGRIDPEKYTLTINEKLEWNDLLALEHEMEEVRAERHGGPAARRRQRANANRGAADAEAERV
jgi:replicative DNA helicase